jgi:Glyoxalase-like domain
MLEGVTFRWLTVFLDFPAAGFGPGIAFWRAVTGYGLSPFRGPGGDFATLLPPSGDAYLRVQRVLSGDGGYHLDLHVDTAGGAVQALDEAADLAVALGATMRHREPGEVIVADSPGGFTFCLVGWEGERAVPAPQTADGRGASRVDTLCLDIPPELFASESAFWAALTGQPPQAAPVPGFAYLSGPAGTGMPVRLLLQRREEAAPGQRVRGHIDLGCADRDAAVAWHVDHGAQVTGTFQYWTVLTDPAGHESGDLGGQRVEDGRLARVRVTSRAAAPILGRACRVADGYARIRLLPASQAGTGWARARPSGSSGCFRRPGGRARAGGGGPHPGGGRAAVAGDDRG